MKKILFIIVCLLLVCGCSSKEITEKSFQKEVLKKYPSGAIGGDGKELVCDALDDVVIFRNDLKQFATKDKIYKLNVKKVYSNNQNCKEIEVIDRDSEFMGYFINAYFEQGFETKESRYSKDTVQELYTPYSLYSTSGTQYRFGDSSYKQWFSSLGEKIIYSYYNKKNYNGFVSADNKIKAFQVDSVFGSNGAEETISYIDVDSSLEEDETVLMILRDVLKTDKAFYRIKPYKTNKEECDKYADIKCIYGFKLVKEEFLSKYYPYIKYADGDNIIDINNHYYTLIP